MPRHFTRLPVRRGIATTLARVPQTGGARDSVLMSPTTAQQHGARRCRWVTAKRAALAFAEVRPVRLDHLQMVEIGHDVLHRGVLGASRPASR
jgi:hypothetical protein